MISNTLLDNSWHFGAMKGLENEIKESEKVFIGVPEKEKY